MLSVCQSGVAGVLPGVVGLQLSHLAIQRAQQQSKDLCQEQGHASSIIWCIVVVVVVATDTHTHTARWRLLRMHYRDHHLHELFCILGCEILYPHKIHKWGIHAVMCIYIDFL